MRIPLAGIGQREKFPGSMMPAGLDWTLSAAQGVGRVAYPTSVKP